MMSLPSTPGITFPAMKGTQGGRTFYLLLCSNDVLNNFISTETEPSVERSQRVLDPKHAQEIGEYIVKNRLEYVLGALTYGVDKDGTFVPVQDGANLGFLHLPLDANVRSIDGQHRRWGIKEALDGDQSVKNDQTAILLYVEPEVTKRRQMFSDMNWTPRVVSKSVNVAFNARDPFAQATNLLVEQHDLLVGRTEMERAWITKSSTNLYTLGAVYEAVRRAYMGLNGKPDKDRDYDVEEIRERAESFFDWLLDSRPELQEAVDRPESVEGLRRTSLVVNGTTLKVLASAFYNLLERGFTPEQLKDPLSDIDFAPSALMWLESGFVPAGSTTPGARNQEVRAATLALTEALLPPAPAGSAVESPAA